MQLWPPEPNLQKTKQNNTCWRRLLICSRLLRLEIITQRLYYLQYCLDNSISIFLASSLSWTHSSPLICVSLCVCGLLARFRWAPVGASVSCGWPYGFSLTLPSLSLYICISISASLYAVKPLAKNSFFINQWKQHIYRSTSHTKQLI